MESDVTRDRRSADTALGILELGALLVFAVAAAATNGADVLSAWVMALFLGLCAALCSGFLIPASARDSRLGFGVSAALLGYLTPAYPAVQVILVWALGTFIGSSIVRRDAISGGRNAARMVVCAFVYTGLWRLVDPLGALPVLGAAVATLGYMAVGLVLDLAALAVRGAGLRGLLDSLMASRLGLAFAINVLLAATVHYAAPRLEEMSPRPTEGLGIIISFTVTAAVFFSFAMLRGSHAARRRFAGVLGSALHLPWPVDEDPFELMRRYARRAVLSDAIDIRDEAPTRAREMGASFRLPTEEERWLVAVRRPARSAFSPDDLDALTAIAHIGQESMRLRREALELEQEANTDPLTGLPNYRAFQLALARARLERADGAGTAVAYLDLDGFKEVNDRHGHEAGNEVLRRVADRLRAAIRPVDSIARVGGDEFVVILNGVADLAHAERITSRIATAVGEPIALDEGRVVSVTASVGIGFSDDPGEDPLVLVEQADRRMYTSRRGRRVPSFATGAAIGVPAPTAESLVAVGPSPEAPPVRPIPSDHIGVVAETIEERRITVVYQPIVDNVTGQVIALEALVRAEHPRFGVIPPPLLVNEARRLDRLDALTGQILEQAFHDVAGFQRIVPELRHVHVNVEVDQIAEERSLGLIRKLTAASPEVDLTLELTENSLNRSTEQLLTRLAELRARGVSLALDDFGQAYSTMLSVVEYPFDVLKVDRALIQDIEVSAKARQVIRSLALLSRKLDVQMIVEGVQTDAQRDVLARLGVRYMQGYLFAPALAAEDLRSRFRRAALMEPNARPAVPEETTPIVGS